jgi:hypothetical protein
MQYFTVTDFVIHSARHPVTVAPPGEMPNARLPTHAFKIFCARHAISDVIPLPRQPVPVTEFVVACHTFSIKVYSIPYSIHDDEDLLHFDFFDHEPQHLNNTQISSPSNDDFAFGNYDAPP